jgi:hypothetical protein
MKTKIQTIQSILDREGRTQKWFRQRLLYHGVAYSQPQISLICSGRSFPKKKSAVKIIALVLDTPEEEITQILNYNGKSEVSQRTDRKTIRKTPVPMEGSINRRRKRG